MTGVPEYWLARAEEARLLVKTLTDPEARRLMLSIAEGYERLAEHAQTRLPQAILKPEQG